MKTMNNFVITDFGAKTDAAFINSEAIQKAVDAAAASGGGRVVVPAHVDDRHDLDEAPRRTASRTGCDAARQRP